MASEKKRIVPRNNPLFHALQERMKSGKYTIITGDGVVVRQPQHPIGVVVVYDRVWQQPIMGMSDCSEEDDVNLNLWVPGILTDKDCGEDTTDRTQQVLDKRVKVPDNVLRILIHAIEITIGGKRCFNDEITIGDLNDIFVIREFLELIEGMQSLNADSVLEDVREVASYMPKDTSVYEFLSSQNLLPTDWEDEN